VIALINATACPNSEGYCGVDVMSFWYKRGQLWEWWSSI